VGVESKSIGGHEYVVGEFGLVSVSVSVSVHEGKCDLMEIVHNTVYNYIAAIICTSLLTCSLFGWLLVTP
jgi:hypothetical protein